MNVLLINHSDLLGGASIASLRLTEALRRQGFDAHLLVGNKRSEHNFVHQLGQPLRRRAAFLAERAKVILQNGLNRATLFKIDAATNGINIASHPLVRQADIIVLNWVNQGMLSLKSIRQLAESGKPIVWTMHDMWNCTGICHYAHECTAYRGACAPCPIIGRDYTHLATRTQRRKASLYQAAPITFVAVSQWLRECCNSSSLMRNIPVEVISNPCPSDNFEYTRLPGDRDHIVMVMGAARLDDPVKGFDILLETMTHIRHNHPQLADRLHLLLYGDIRDRGLLDRIDVGHTYLGYIDNINEVFRKADIVLSMARYESFGYTIAEGMASGCLPVVAGRGGQVDIVDHLANGYICASTAPADVAQAIIWAADHIENNGGHPITRAELHRHIAERFHPDVIAGQYAGLFSRLLPSR